MTEMITTEIIIPLEKEPTWDTDSSLNKSQGPKQQEPSPTKPSKKRIGPYCYKLNDIIGSGFTSTVYKGCKDNNKNNLVAIKVVNLVNMKQHRRQLLENEIRILKKVDHPNILAFQDLYFTTNNCYIITQYCEGGSLQQAVSTNQPFDWRKAAYEVSMGIQHLTSLNIIHRDLKPSNVLIKNGVYKICDFGFSCQFITNQPIKQDYLIGSPLYMPPESIRDHIYSSKSDSFALGVLLYYISSKKFPWKGKSKAELIENYEHKKYNKGRISFLAPRVKHLISALLQTDPEKRMHLFECDFEVFLHLGPQKPIEDQLEKLQQKYTQQLKICQFVNSILRNYDNFTWANSFLKAFIERHLNSLTIAFKWKDHQAMYSIKKGYNLPEEDPNFTSDDYYWLNNCLKDTVKVLSAQFDPLAHIMLEKILIYQQLIEVFLFQPHQKVVTAINALVVHSNFSLVRPDEVYISRSLGKIDFYDL